MIFLRENTEVSVSYVIYIIGALLALVLQFLLARFMGAYEYGIYSFVLSCLMIISLVPRFGLDTILTRYLSEFYVKKQWEYFHGVFSFTYNFSALISIPLIILVYLIINTVKLSLDFNINILNVGLLAIPVICFSRFNQSSIQSLKRPSLSLVGNYIINPILIITGAVIVNYLSTPVAETLIWIYCTALLTSQVIMIILLEKVLSNIPESRTRNYKIKEWIFAAVPLFVASGLNVLLGRIDILMLEFISGPRDVGIYTIASLIATPISFILIAINTVLAPEIASRYQTGDINEIQAKLTKYMEIALAVTIPCVLIVILGGNYILHFFGTEFTEGYIALLILTIGQFLNVFMGSVGVIMNMTNRQRLAAIMLFSAVIVNIILNLLLIPGYGKTGAAVATTLTVMLWNYMMYLHITGKLLIDPSAIPLIRKYLIKFQKGF